MRNRSRMAQASPLLYSADRLCVEAETTSRPQSVRSTATYQVHSTKSHKTQNLGLVFF